MEVVLRKLNFVVSAIVLSITLHAALGQTLTVSPNPLNLSGQAGATSVQGQLTITSNSPTPVNFVVFPNQTWLSVPQVPSVGYWTTPVTLTVTANPSLLQPGNNAGGLTVNAGGTLSTVTINVAVSSIAVNPASVALGSYQAGSSVYPGTVPLTVLGAGSGAFQIAKGSGDFWYTAAQSGNTVFVAIDPSQARNLVPQTYNGVLTITPTGVANPVGVNVPISLVVTAAPQVTVSPGPSNGLAFYWQLTGTNNQAQQNIQLSTTSTANIGYSVQGSANWIAPSGSGVISAGSGQVLVSVNGALLPAATTPYAGSVTITLSNAQFSSGQSSITIPITLFVSNLALINVPTAAANFTYQFGSNAAVTPISVTPTSTAAPNSQLQYSLSILNSAPWLSVPTGLQITGTPFSISVNPAGLAPQTAPYTATVVLTPVGNGSGQPSITIPVTLAVTNAPSLSVTPAALVFPYQIGQSLPTPQVVTIASNSGAPLNYQVSVPSSATWLQVSGSLTGLTDQTFITLAVNPPNTASATPLDAGVVITATDPATGLAAGSVTVDVKLYISATPLLTVSPSVLPTFNVVAGGSPASTTVSLKSTSAAAADQLTITGAVVSANWLATNQIPSTTPGTLTVVGLPLGNTPGSYPGNVQITANLGANAVADSPYILPATVQVNAATGVVSTTPLSFTQAKGAAVPAAQQISVATSGASLPFTAVVNDGGINWLSVSSATGATPGAVNVLADATKLTPGTYLGAVYVSMPNAFGGNGPLPGQFRVPVSFTVTPGTISAPTAPLTFTQVQGGGAPVTQTIAVSGAPSSLNFTVSTNTQNSGTWLTATVGTAGAATGATPANVQVAVNSGTLAPGTYNGNVVITAAGASGSPITVPVTLTVVAAQSLTVSPNALTFSYTINGAAPATQTAQVTASGSGAQIAVATKSTDTWLSVTSSSATAPTTLTVKITPAGLAAGTYSSPVTITSPSSTTAATLTVNLTVVAVPTPVINGVLNAASNQGGALAPGENIVITGTGIGPATLVQTAPSGGAYPNTVGATQVLFDGVPAPMIYAWTTQTSAMVPFEVAGRSTTVVTVVYQGVTSAPLTYNIAPASPAIYSQNSSGSGPGSILNQDYSLNGQTKPAAKGSYIQIYMTGAGATSPSAVTGAVAPTSTLKNIVLPLSATVGGVPVSVTPGNFYAGSAPGIIEGVCQVNIQIPATAPSGPQPLVLTFGSGSATYSTQQNLTVQVQ